MACRWLLGRCSTGASARLIRAFALHVALRLKLFFELSPALPQLLYLRKQYGKHPGDLLSISM